MKVNLHCLLLIQNQQILILILGHIILTITCPFSGKTDKIKNKAVYTDQVLFHLILKQIGKDIYFMREYFSMLLLKQNIF